MELEVNLHSLLQAVLPEYGDCLDCAVCCQFPSIRVSQAELKSISEALGIGVGAFKRRFITMRDNKMFIDEPHGCPFLGKDDNICGIYEKRPLQCRVFPFKVDINEGTIYALYVEVCPLVTAFVDGFLSYLQEFSPITYKAISMSLEQQTASPYIVALPIVLVLQYIAWVFLDEESKERFKKCTTIK